MELLTEDLVVKITVRKRESGHGASSSVTAVSAMMTNTVQKSASLVMDGTSPPGTKETSNCYVAIRKMLGASDCFLSIKTTKNKQVGKNIPINFRESVYGGKRIEKLGDFNINFRPDPHLSTNGKELESIAIQFLDSVVCGRWYVLLCQIAGESQEDRGQRYDDKEYDRPERMYSEKKKKKDNQPKLLIKAPLNQVQVLILLPMQWILQQNFLLVSIINHLTRITQI